MNPQDPTQPTPEPAPTPPVEPMQPQAGQQPMPTAPAATQPYPQAAPAASENKTDTLGIISIILAFVGVQLIGLILGIVGNNKAKKEGYSNKLSKIGIVLNVVFMVISVFILAALIAVSYQGAKDVANDTSGINNINSVHTELENYYIDNQYYPESLESLSKSGTFADAIQEVSSSSDYRYTPSGCVSEKCASYELSFEGADGENYTLTSVY